MNKEKRNMKITVCIGSSCHIKGSRQVVEEFRRLIRRYNLEDKVELAGTFCMGECLKGVCVAVDDKVCSVSHDTVEEFFNKNVLECVK
ncbi:NAD(P)H-dependent oxidoreductase subunit E [Thermoclostridium stercorarium]|jgi:NADH:ubiquinone oxidoreductase subunit E|nr:NAD(P)H-dependent oxidoreductase subunit E [Thermoclostridium stercorarium]UZQ84858.1 NAD(P)H-dependent oxidoreductase subunit E [Thermoclostridium stercorarium]